VIPERVRNYLMFLLLYGSSLYHLIYSFIVQMINTAMWGARGITRFMNTLVCKIINCGAA
jgi:hypothetical protein